MDFDLIGLICFLVGCYERDDWLYWQWGSLGLFRTTAIFRVSDSCWVACVLHWTDIGGLMLSVVHGDASRMWWRNIDDRGTWLWNWFVENWGNWCQEGYITLFWNDSPATNKLSQQPMFHWTLKQTSVILPLLRSLHVRAKVRSDHERVFVKKQQSSVKTSDTGTSVCPSYCIDLIMWRGGCFMLQGRSTQEFESESAADRRSGWKLRWNSVEQSLDQCFVEIWLMNYVQRVELSLCFWDFDKTKWSCLNLFSWVAERVLYFVLCVAPVCCLFVCLSQNTTEQISLKPYWKDETWAKNKSITFLSGSGIFL